MIITPGAVAIRKPTDDTLKLLSLVSVPNATVTLDAGRTYRVRTVRFAAGVTLEIPATTTIEVQDNGLAASNSLYVGVAGVTITGTGTIRGTSTARTAVYGLIRAELADDLHIDGITLHTSPSIAIWTLGGSGLRVSGVTVHDTAADGIHVSRGATDFQVTDCTVYDVGDDGVSTVAYIDQGYTHCTNGLFARNTVTNATVGRGICCSGGDTVTIERNTIDGTDQAGIIVAGGGGRAANVTIRNNDVNDCGRTHVLGDGGTGDGIYVTLCDGATLTSNAVTNSPFNGINLIDSLSTALVDGGGNSYSGIALQNLHQG